MSQEPIDSPTTWVAGHVKKYVKAGFVHAMRPTMALPIAVVAVGAAACLLARHRQTRSPRNAPITADLSTST